MIRADEERAKSEAKHLRTSNHHLIIYTDGSRLPKDNTAAAAWSQRSKKSMNEGLGPARSHGIYKAEYRGLHLGLTLALREASALTRIVTIILNNQSVIKDMRSLTHSLTSLLDKQRAYTILMYIERAYPGARVMIRWCPGHEGIKGNKIVDKLAKATAKRNLSDTTRQPPGIAAFQAAIKEWVRASTIKTTNDSSKRLGHEYQTPAHIKHLKKIKKHSIAAITQLCSGHAPLNHHLHKYQQKANPACECETGVKTVDHFLFICPRYDHQRVDLLKALKAVKIKPSKSIWTQPKAYAATAEYCEDTWRFKDHWVWASIAEEPTPHDL